MKIVLPQKVITKSPLFPKLLPKHHHFLIAADNERYQNTYFASKLEWQQT